MKKRFVSFLCVVAIFVFGMTTMAVIDRWPSGSEIVEASTDPEIVVVADYPNPTAINFTLTQPFAPFYPIEEGMSGRLLQWFLEADTQEEYDPFRIGIDDAMSLMSTIRHKVAGVDDDMYADGYTLHLYIVESHLPRKAEIIEQILAILEDFEANRSFSIETAE